MAKKLFPNGKTLIIYPNGAKRTRAVDPWPAHAVYTSWPELIENFSGSWDWWCIFTLLDGNTWYYNYGYGATNPDAGPVQDSYYFSPIGQIPPEAIGLKFNFWTRPNCRFVMTEEEALDYIESH